MEKEKSIGALWAKKNSKGMEYYTGKVRDEKIVIFKNSFKKDEKHPDFQIYPSKPIKEGDEKISDIPF